MWTQHPADLSTMPRLLSLSTRIGPDLISPVVTQADLDTQLAAAVAKVAADCQQFTTDAVVNATKPLGDQVQNIAACQAKQGLVTQDGTCAELPRPFAAASAANLDQVACGKDQSGHHGALCVHGWW